MFHHIPAYPYGRVLPCPGLPTAAGAVALTPGMVMDFGRNGPGAANEQKWTKCYESVMSRTDLLRPVQLCAPRPLINIHQCRFGLAALGLALHRCTAGL